VPRRLPGILRDDPLPDPFVLRRRRFGSLYTSIFPQFAASTTYVLVSLLIVKTIYTYPGLLLLLYTTTVEFNFLDSALSTFPNSILDTDGTVCMLGYLYKTNPVSAFEVFN